MIKYDGIHTPTPWKVVTEYANAKNCADIWTAEDRGNIMIAECRTAGKLEQGQADAQFIVIACNSHYELLEALKETTELLSIIQDEPFSNQNRIKEWVAKAGQAIAKAQGK